MKIHKIIGVFCLLGLLLSCNRDDIVHPYTPDLSKLSEIDTKRILNLKNLPKPSNQLAENGLNSESNSSQPDGIKDWKQYERPSEVPGRNVTIDLRIFNDIQSTIKFMEFYSVSRWYRPKVEKFNKGVYPNGLAYCASYIVQHRADPEGCSRPTNSYSSFLLIRSGQSMVSVNVHEINTDKPLGVTASDMKFAIELLNS